jgi:short-subunit dehydrogenase
MFSGVALITGAASGIGRQFAVSLAREGMSIAAVDRSGEGLAALEEELKRLNRTVAWEVADVSDAAGLRDKVELLEGRLGPTELLIANAGVGIETSALNYRAEDVATVVQVNLLGVSNSIAAILPGMMQRRRGHIVGISSLASFRGLPRMLAYCASKAGVNALLDGLRVEVGPFNIAVTTICPGWIQTPMTADLDLKVKGKLRVEDAVERMLGAIRRRRPFFAFPPSLAWQMRFLAWLPRSVGDWLVARLLARAERK